MSRRGSVPVGVITAVSEDGREFRIYVCQPSAAYEMEWFEGETELLTHDDEPVKYLGKGQYEVQAMLEQITVKSIDPRAP